MKVISFPNWFEPKTLSYIADFFNGENKVEVGENSFIFDHEIPRDYLTSPDLERIWSRAKKRYPKDASKGQIELFRMIEFSFRQKEDNWTTEREAGLWRKRFLATLEKLERLWDEIPSNFMSDAGDSQGLFRADEQYGNVPEINEFKKVIEQLEYAKPVHGRQTVGKKAEKLHFLRELSIQFFTEMREWKQTDVAQIATAIYGVEVSASDVMRATRDMRESPIEDC